MKKDIKRVRKIDGKKFELLTLWKTKKAAKEEAKRMRKPSYMRAGIKLKPLVRVIKTKYGWATFIHRRSFKGKKLIKYDK